MKLIAASQNRHKLEEINAIVKDFGMELISMKDAGLGDLDIEETGTTFEENSLIKANEVCRLTGCAAIADDTGLMVDALDGAPGVYSARYAGEHGNDAANRKKLLKALEGIDPERRTARFVCVITLVRPDGTKLVARGECPGRIIDEERGTNGFGYDSVFTADGETKSFAELAPEQKNRISHRAKALLKLQQLLRNDII